MILAPLAAIASLSAAPVEARVIGASLFKNGYAVLTRSARLSAGAEEIVFDEIPNATLGSFWLASQGGLVIHSAVNGEIKETVRQPLGTLNEIIAANTGRQVVVNLQDARPGEAQTLEGELVSAAGEIMIVRAKGSDEIINKSRVARLSVIGGAVYDKESVRTRRVMRLRTNGKPGAVFMMSLERGMSWQPAYALDLKTDTKLQIRSRGTIINDLAELKDVEVKLITGFPNVRYLGMFDPFTSSASPAALREMAPAPAAGAFAGNALMTQRAGFGGGGFAADLPETGGEGGFTAEDLFFYQQPGVTLARGERGYYELFTAELDYRPVYTADLSGWTRDQGERPDVWHTIRVKNTTPIPFTTGPAMTVKNGEVIAQDELAYVPVRPEGSLRLTKSLSIIADQEDVEISRERGAISDREGRPILDLVTYRTKMSIQNLKNRDIEMQVTRTLQGQPVGDPSPVTATPHPQAPGQANAPLRIDWKPAVRPGATIEAEYTWTAYLPSLGR